MRLEEFPAKFKLEYTPGNIESMRKALEEYTRLVKSEEAFEDSYCVAHFYHTWDKISIDYFEGYPKLVDYLTSVSYYYTKESNNDDLQKETTGETLFFLCALMHPELKDDVVKACKAIVEFARRKNDSSEMWLTCEHPFGIEPLSITAFAYPEYGYLLASFLVPYWDDEHMPEPLFMLWQWSRNIGITKDTLKAYCYCDNSRARTNMLGYDTWNGCYGEDDKIESPFDLLSYFRDTPEGYDEFVREMANRLTEMPIIDKEQNGHQFITERVFEILYVHKPCDSWDDDFDVDAYLLNTFINTSADKAIRKMEQI